MWQGGRGMKKAGARKVGRLLVKDFEFYVVCFK